MSFVLKGDIDMILFKVVHKRKLKAHFEQKYIGIYSCEENAKNAVEKLKQKTGFCDTKPGFRIKKVFRIFRPRFVDKTFWVDGFVTYKY